MINIVSIRFTWYDHNGVGAVTAIVPLLEFKDSLIGLINDLKVPQWNLLSDGVIMVHELQLIEDSVLQDSFSFPVDAELLSDFKNYLIHSDFIEPYILDVFEEHLVPEKFWKALHDKVVEVQNASRSDAGAGSDSDEA